MGEVLGAVSAIAGLISLSGTILAEGYAFVASVYRAPKELRELLCESAALDAVLDQIQGFADEGVGIDSKTAKLKDLAQAGVMKECKESLLTVQRSIIRCQQVKGEEVRNLGKRVAWPFKEKETKETLTRLSRIRGHLATILTADMTATLRSVQKSSQEMSIGVTELQNRAIKRDQAEERRALLKWLDPNSINVEDNLQEGLKNHHPGTGQWLFQSDCFKSWSRGPSSLLWIHGIPGSGKTVLADSNKRTLQHFLAVGILQLLDQYPGYENETASMFRKYGNDAKNAISLDDQLTLFATLAQKFLLVTMVVDALDECKELDKFVDGLKHLMAITKLTIRMLTTGRSDYSLEKSVGALATHRIALEQNIKNDINAFVTDEVNSRIVSRKLKIRSHDLKELVIHSLSQHANGMFIWATLQLDLLSRLTNEKAIRDALYKLPRGLEDTYIRLLEQIKDRNTDNLEAVRKALMWLVSTLNPLTLGRLTEAISIEPGDTRRDTEKMIMDDRDLLEMLGSLVTVDSTLEDPVVSLVHFSLYEFLGSDALRDHESLCIFHVPFRYGMDVGITCIQYLSFSDFKTPCQSSQQLHERKISYKLFEFAALNWTSQIISYGGRGPGIKTLLRVMNWFIEPCRDNNQNFISWQQAFHNEVDSSLIPVDPLYYAVDFQMTNLFDILIQRGSNPAYLYDTDFTVLHLAVITGREDNVSAILQTGPDLEALTNRSQTALHLAAEYGYVCVVNLLLKAGAFSDAQSDSGSTPFYRAARSGSIPVMELLYQAGSDINAVTWDGWRPIFEAMENMHVPVVKWLVRKGAQLNHSISDGPSVLEYAKKMGNKEVVDLVESNLSRS
ncbi:hypothetical protein MMC17_000573 [Xylographa soralifera]|nr:hypothetical protein [Xylographa soralifera]